MRFSFIIFSIIKTVLRFVSGINTDSLGYLFSSSSTDENTSHVMCKSEPNIQCRHKNNSDLPPLRAQKSHQCDQIYIRDFSMEDQLRKYSHVKIQNVNESFSHITESANVLLEFGVYKQFNNSSSSDTDTHRYRYFKRNI